MHRARVSKDARAETPLFHGEHAKSSRSSSILSLPPACRTTKYAIVLVAAVRSHFESMGEISAETDDSRAITLSLLTDFVLVYGTRPLLLESRRFRAGRSRRRDPRHRRNSRSSGSRWRRLLRGKVVLPGICIRKKREREKQRKKRDWEERERGREGRRKRECATPVAFLSLRRYHVELSKRRMREIANVRGFTRKRRE